MEGDVLFVLFLNNITIVIPEFFRCRDEALPRLYNEKISGIQFISL